MTSMIHSKTYSPVLFQKIRVSTDLYGVNCRVYTPVSIQSGFMSYGDIEYSKDLFLENKLLIPKAVLFRSNNAFSDISFFEEPVQIWSTLAIPKYSKVIVIEVSEIISFIITDISTTEDSRFKDIYYKYTLTPSSSTTSDEKLDIEDLNEVENLDPEFNSSILHMNPVSTVIPSARIKVNKL